MKKLLIFLSFILCSNLIAVKTEKVQTDSKNQETLEEIKLDKIEKGENNPQEEKEIKEEAEQKTKCEKLKGCSKKLINAISLKSLGKSISWRFIGTFISYIISLLLLGDAHLAYQISLSEAGIKIFALYGHDRAWEADYKGCYNKCKEKCACCTNDEENQENIPEDEQELKERSENQEPGKLKKFAMKLCHIFDPKAFGKSVSWRFFGTLITYVMTYVFIGNANLALTISASEAGVKIVGFYLHERIWDADYKGCINKCKDKCNCRDNQN